MRISILGSGNVATHLGRAFFRSGHKIIDVCSPTPGHAASLATELNARAIQKAGDFDQDTDLCLIAVKDDAIEEVARGMGFQKALVAHTAGSIPMEVLKGSAPGYGVFYPFQTFSGFREPDLSEAPFCLEASSPGVMRRLSELAESIRGRAYEVDSAGRRRLHLAAVIACNFTNHLYTLADELLQEQGLSPELLRPLIMETAEKVMEAAPFEAQTGPAVRNDRLVIEDHLRQLEHKPELQELYKLLSASITNLHLKDDK